MFARASIQIRALNKNSWVTIISAISKDIRHMNIGPRPLPLKDLKDTSTIVRIMDIDYMNANLMASGH